jgi:hypothetical protein
MRTGHQFVLKNKDRSTDADGADVERNHNPGPQMNLEERPAQEGLPWLMDPEFEPMPRRFPCGAGFDDMFLALHACRGA